MEKIVDARGLACPQPVIKAKEALKGMEEGILKV
ncbi:MAG TPA: sulfurtransferase-like selenium metabolism protein YedF, partial [Clostridium sp.]|nr:sulfurtransferase-like selenium metabolism protein YedF [Clostridium sp.]